MQMSTIRVFYVICAIFILIDFAIRARSFKSPKLFCGPQDFPVRSLRWFISSLTIPCIFIFLSGCGVQSQNGALSTAATSQASSTTPSYQTTFSDTENPLSQNGKWINGGTTGLDWNNCQSTPGFAFGTQPGTQTGDDSICVLSGNWNANQSAQMTVKIKSTSNASEELEEVWVRTTIAAHSVTGYEVTCSVSPNDPFLRLTRWDGPRGDYAVLANASTGCKNGDVVQAAISGSSITVYKNGTSMLTATDSKYTSGSPGMGFYIQNVQGTASAADAEFGVSAFSAAGSAGSNSSSGGSSAGTISVNATSLPFGSVALNQPAIQPLTVTNYGGSAITVSAVTVTGAGFSLQGAALPLTLSPGQNATLNVQFDPTAAGAASGELTINSTSSSNAVAQLSLSGTGVSGTGASGTGAVHQVDLNWSAPASSSDPVAGYNIYRSAGGSSFQRLNSSVDKQTTYQDGSAQAGATYEYYVTTVDGSGAESAPSNTITVPVP